MSLNFVTNAVCVSLTFSINTIAVHIVWVQARKPCHKLKNLTETKPCKLLVSLFCKDIVFTRKIVNSAQFVMILRLIWVNEFMPNLTLRQKWFQSERNVRVGDVVLLAKSMQQRSKWVMGRVLETYPDKHGKVGTVLLKTSGSTIKRPIAKLCVIFSESAC